MGTSVGNLWFILVRDEKSIDRREKNIHLFIPLLIHYFDIHPVFSLDIYYVLALYCVAYREDKLGVCLSANATLTWPPGRYEGNHSMCVLRRYRVFLQHVYQEHILRDVELPENLPQK